MTTVQDLLERTRRHLYTETADERNRLTSAVISSDTVLTFDFDMGGIAVGSTIAVGLEEMLVWSIANNTATVQRGQGGSVATSHAAGDMVWVKPKMSPFAIFQAINEDLLDLSNPTHGLFQVKTVGVAYDGNTAAYDLSGVTDLIAILDVTYPTIDGTGLWKTIPRSQWRLKRSMPTGSFSSGLDFSLMSYAMPGQPINITYKAGFTPFAALTDTLTTAGLPSSCGDLPPLGAAIRLTAGGEVARNFLNQGETRRANEVPPGARLGSMRDLMMLRQQRITAEAARLYAQYPVVRA